MNAIVVQAVPNLGSTTRNMSIDKKKTTINMYRYSAAKKALAPLSMCDPISNSNYDLSSI